MGFKNPKPEKNFFFFSFLFLSPFSLSLSLLSPRSSLPLSRSTTVPARSGRHQHRPSCIDRPQPSSATDQLGRCDLAQETPRNPCALRAISSAPLFRSPRHHLDRSPARHRRTKLLPGRIDGRRLRQRHPPAHETLVHRGHLCVSSSRHGQVAAHLSYHL